MAPPLPVSVVAEAALFGSLFDVGMTILAVMDRTEIKNLKRSVISDPPAKFVVGYPCLLQTLYSLNPYLPDTMEIILDSLYCEMG